MKSFKTYLSESQKTYDFRVRIAGDVTAEQMTKMKAAMEAYSVKSVSTTKRLPIQETNLFPNMGPTEVSIFDVSVCYPANDDLIRNAIAECGCYSANCIKVTPANSPYEAILDGTEVSNLGGKPGDAVLLQDNMERERPGPGGDALVGDARIPNFMKELEETRKYTYPDVAGGKETNKSFMSQGTTNQLPQGNASPVGTHKNKITNPRAMKAGNGK